MGYNAIEGYILNCKDMDMDGCFVNVLIPFRQINPTTKIIVMLRKSISLNETQYLFEKAWNELKILNLMLINIEAEKTFVYNPFKQETNVINITNVTFNFAKFVKNRLENVYGYPLRVNVFDCILLCRVIYNKKYELTCSEMLNALKRMVNFTLEYIEPNDATTFGFVSPNKTFMGSLGEIEYDRVDLAADLRIIANFDDATNIYFLKPLGEVSYCFVVPNNFYPLQFQVFPHRFVDLYTFILFVISLSFLILTNFTMDKLAERESAIILDHKQSLVKVVLCFFSLYCNVSITKTPTRLYARILIGCFLVFNIIIANSYQGSIITQLNRMSSAGNIMTIEKLLESGLIIRVPSGPDKYIRDFQTFPLNSTQRQLFDKKIITDTMSEPQIKYAAYKREAAIMCPNHYIHDYKTKFLSNTTGESLINYVPQCVYSYYMSVMVSKSSPFIKRFNQIIQIIIEAGLIRYQYSKGMSELQLQYIKLAKDDLVFEVQVRLLGMKEMSTLFAFYVIWLCFTFVVFVLEIVISKNKGLFNRVSIFVGE